MLYVYIYISQAPQIRSAMYPHKSNNSVGIINYRSYRLGPWLPSPRCPCCTLQFSMLLRQNSGVMIVMWSGSKSRNLGFFKFETQDSLYLWIPSQGRSRGHEGSTSSNFLCPNLIHICSRCIIVGRWSRWSQHTLACIMWVVFGVFPRP